MKLAVIPWCCFLVTCTAYAQPAPLPNVPGADGVIRMQPAERDSFSVVFEGRTISAAGSITAVLRGIPKQADASPTAQIIAHSASGSTVSFTILPDTSCGTAGCRAGNNYEIILQPTDSDGNKPIANVWLSVQKKLLSGGQ